MSKLKRSALKSVVKECLLEILSEGLDTTVAVSKNIQPRGNAAVQQNIVESREEKIHKKTMQDTIAGITSDHILASILNETAQTTLIEQTGADRTSQISKLRGNTSSSTQDQQEPDGNSHWAALAFADKK